MLKLKRVYNHIPNRLVLATPYTPKYERRNISIDASDKPDISQTLPIIQCNSEPLFPKFKKLETVRSLDLVHVLKNRFENKNPFVGVFMKNNTNEDDQLVEKSSDLWSVGTLALAHEIPMKNGGLRLLLTGMDRIKMIEPVFNSDCKSKLILMATVENFDFLKFEQDQHYDAMTLVIVKAIRDIIDVDSEAANIFIGGISENREHFYNVEYLCDLAAMISKPNAARLQAIMEEPDIPKRMVLALEMLKMHMANMELQNKVVQDVEASVSAMQKKLMLTEQIKILKKELGIKNDKERIVDKYVNLIKKNSYPQEVQRCINYEISKLKSLDVNSSEFSIVHTYLDWIIQIPWMTKTEDNFNIDDAKYTLDANHFGMDEVKARILEFIAIANLKGTTKGKIICLHGSPGVGKTSIARSIARALNRKFYRINVGGLGNVSELKGHRRTYVGALPGKIVQCLKATGVLNPVILVDEIDKILSSRSQERPAAALLEILDPEQNSNFVDHYLDIPIDLSNVLFICTANDLGDISGPLLDRMELISLTGYTSEEKFIIAKNYLVPKILKESGLQSKAIGFLESGIMSIVNMYCREAGVRNLERQLEKITRCIALQICTGKRKHTFIADTNIHLYLGNCPMDSYQMFQSPPPGVVTGLAYTCNGGDILFIETAREHCHPNAIHAKDTKLKLTGQLGPVMRDSAEIALTFARNFMQQIDPNNSFLECNKIHLHVPKCIQPKEGPSAGVTITTALISLALERPVQSNIAMTGAISLMGKVQAVGGIKEKVIAAKRNGIERIILAEDNRCDFEDISKDITKDFHVHFVGDYREIFDIVFAGKICSTET